MAPIIRVDNGPLNPIIRAGLAHRFDEFECSLESELRIYGGDYATDGQVRRRGERREGDRETLLQREREGGGERLPFPAQGERLRSIFPAAKDCQILSPQGLVPAALTNTAPSDPGPNGRLGTGRLWRALRVPVLPPPCPRSAALALHCLCDCFTAFETASLPL